MRHSALTLSASDSSLPLLLRYGFHTRPGTSPQRVPLAGQPGLKWTVVSYPTSAVGSVFTAQPKTYP